MILLGSLDSSWPDLCRNPKNLCSFTACLCHPKWAGSWSRGLRLLVPRIAFKSPGGSDTVLNTICNGGFLFQALFLQMSETSSSAEDESVTYKISVRWDSRGTEPGRDIYQWHLQSCRKTVLRDPDSMSLGKNMQLDWRKLLIHQLTWTHFNRQTQGLIESIWELWQLNRLISTAKDTV